LLCGGYTLKSLISEYFKDKDVSTIDVPMNTVPSVKNMELIEKSYISKLETFKFPWDLITKNKEIINENLIYKVKNGNYKKYQEGVYIGENVKISKNVVFKNYKKDVIVIDNYSQILDFVVIEAPCYIGQKTKVNSFTLLKDGSCIGDVCKVGGEIEASIISNYSNKQHYGFLGHSFVGEWVNLGAGTSNSDLKNTYGEISIDYQNQKTKTGQQFLGCILLDYVKTAINTSIYTGKILGVNSHVYGDVLSNVPSFVNLVACLKGQNEEFRLEEAIQIQKRMFERRDKIQSKEDIDSLKYVFDITKEERIKFLTK
jgi:glucose-1-phosphate thymidylyltransferase